MFAIIGLGNPGEKYQNNRHNVGFMFVDYVFGELASWRVGEFKLDSYSHTELAKLVIKNKEIILVKPQTFMNRSGIAAKQIIKNFKLKIGNLVIVHDDLDIPLGKFKIQKGTGPKLHNGIESIENALKTKDFLRVRIGIDNRKPQTWVDGETYVLQNFTDIEQQVVLKAFSPLLHRISSAII